MSSSNDNKKKQLTVDETGMVSKESIKKLKEIEEKTGKVVKSK